MVESMSEAPGFKEAYDEAVQKYEDSNSITFSIAILFCVLTLSVFSAISSQHDKQPLFMGESIFLQFGSENTQILETLLIFFFSGILLTIYISFRVKRARQNPALNCPLCSESLAKESTRSQILMTGICPHCKHHLFQGKLSSEEEAIQHYHKNKTKLKTFFRSTLRVSILGILASTPIYFWMKNSNKILGQEAPSIGFYFCFVPALFLFWPVLMWISWKLSCKRDQQCIHLFREISQ